MNFSHYTDPVLESAEELLKKRGRLSLSHRFDIDVGLKTEEYSIKETEGMLTISGGSASAVMFGVGRLIREPGFRGSSSPDKSYRGIYFATHFGNWYDNASEDEIDRYLEDLVIWGCNTINVWFDRHQFRNIAEPRAQSKLKNLKHILKKSARLGMKNYLTSLANEAYADSPTDLRADWVGLKNGYKTDCITGHYHVELCPSKLGALDLLIRWHEEMLNAFSDVPIHYFGIFCYDQGGCTCADCAPYGANGYWKIIPRLSDLIRKKFPDCKIVLSTWRFDQFTDGEWDHLRRNTVLLHKYADMLAVDNCDLENLNELEDDIPAIGFTDISMLHQLPWGGYGANPYPAFLETFRKEDRLCGNNAYSEGIFEDVNKIMLLGSEWDTNCSAWEMLRKYAAFYFGQETSELIPEISRLMERNLDHSADVAQNGKTFCAYFTDQVDPEIEWKLFYTCRSLDKDRAERCMELVKQAEMLMTKEKSTSWRWRLYRLRAEIDMVLANGGEPEESAIRELHDMYHCGSGTLPCLLPPSGDCWRKIISERRPSLV